MNQRGRGAKGADSSQLRGVVRTLSVLRALNHENRATVTGLSLRTGIPRPSLYRILDTLCGAGYIRRRLDEERYELTTLVRTLSEGFTEEAWVCEVAVPVLADLQLEVIWPTDIATFMSDAMYLRETTRPRSPLTIDRATTGLRLPMLLSATGKAYIAYCPEPERVSILERLARSRLAEDALARNPRLVHQILSETRKNGYGQRSGKSFRPETGSISVPVLSGDQVKACLNITFISSALTPREAAARHLPALKAAARKIETALSTGAPQ
ncbi:MAG: IclR family transcriptional regulator C-terminal domain-containing protein [Burkholderiales bacterium]